MSSSHWTKCPSLQEMMTTKDQLLEQLKRNMTRSQQLMKSYVDPTEDTWNSKRMNLYW